jgi:hypothetical protein
VRVPVRWDRLLLWSVAVCLLITLMLGFMDEAGQHLATVLAVPIGIGGLLIAIAAWLHPRVATVEDPLDTAATALALAQAEQWGAEYSARQVQDPYPLPVRWQVSSRAATVMASWASIRGAPNAGAIPLDGTYDRIADVFGHPDSPRRLVVVGEPGAGKSMLVLHLTLELLRRRTATEPVPVLLAIWGWDPRRPLGHWIAERLAADNRYLARRSRAPDGTSRTIAHRLVARGRFLPILDGLDELTPCTCRECRLGSSGGVLVFVEDATEAVAAVDVQAGELVRVGDRLGQWFEWSVVRDPLMRSVEVVEPFVLPECMQQMSLVPDQRAVQQLAAAAPHPAFHNRVHAGHLNSAEHDLDAGLGQDRVEYAWILAVSVAD